MKRLVTTIFAAWAVCAGAAASSAVAEGTYFVGESPGIAKVSFVVRDGNVERALLTARGLRCSDGARANLFKPYHDIALAGNRFARKHRPEGGFQAAFKGHVYRDEASGRLELAEPGCSTGRISWDAKSVSREHWLEMDSRLAGPGR